MRVLAISGSLRAASSNSAILRAAVRVSPPDVHLHLHDGLDALPYFNPDLDRTLDDPLLPPAVRGFRAQVAAADAVIISSPEYAHGISGLMKNALDWLVGGPEMVGKRVAFINTSPHAVHGIAALAETLRTMSVALVDDACVTIAVPRGMTDDALAREPAIVQALDHSLRRLASTVATS